MRTIRGRFILSHILPILLVLPLFGFGLIYLLETQVLLDDLSADVDERANLIAEAVSRQPEILADAEQAGAFVTSYNFIVKGNISILDSNGALLASSDPQLQGSLGQTVDEILSGEGLNRALEGQPSVQVTYSVTRQRGEALIPVKDVNQQLVGIVAVTETLEGLAGQFGQLRQLVLIILLVELLLAVLLALFLARRLGRPILAVTEAVTEIAQGQRVEPIPVEGPEEVKELATSVNILAERLRSLENTRRRLLANLVHEIGRPLGAIRAAIHALRHGAGDDPVVRDELLKGIEDEVIRLQPLLDDLAQLHGQVLGTLELAREPVALSEWLPPVLLAWRAAALEKGLAWQADIPANLPTIEVDSDRMRQVIGNLLSNAIKYTEEGGTVSVAAGSDKGQVWFKISDNGPGIVMAEQEQIFEPFYRSKQQRRFPQGLGLGLTIARDLTEAHGGRLEMESQPGEGSTFTVMLPLQDNQ